MPSTTPTPSRSCRSRRRCARPGRSSSTFRRSLPRPSAWRLLCASWVSTMCSTPTLPPTSPSWRRAASFLSASRTKRTTAGRCSPPAARAGCAFSSRSIPSGRRSFPPRSPRSRCSAPLPRPTLPRRSALIPSGCSSCPSCRASQRKASVRFRPCAARMAFPTLT